MLCCCFFFFNDTATTEIYTLSLHDALPIYPRVLTVSVHQTPLTLFPGTGFPEETGDPDEALGSAVNLARSEEHTSELQSRQYLVCRLLLEKKKTHTLTTYITTSHT